MKILLDESLPRKLRNEFGNGNETWTVKDKQWLGKKNGELLSLMKADGFEVFVTIDRNLPYQQNVSKLGLVIFVLCAPDNRLETLKPLIPKIFQRIETGDLPNIVEIY